MNAFNFSSLRAEIKRPMTRFGMGIYIVQGDPVTHVARWEGNGWDGHLVMVEYKPGTEVEPTWLMDDLVVEALATALEGRPLELRNAAAVSHLQDAIEVRDRLLAIVESHHLPGIMYHQPQGKAPE